MDILLNILHGRADCTVHVILNICVFCLSQGVVNQTGKLRMKKLNNS